MKPNRPMRRRLAGTVTALFMAVAGSAFAQDAYSAYAPPMSGQADSSPVTIPYSDFIDNVRAGRTGMVTLYGNRIKTAVSGAPVESIVPRNENVVQTLQGVKVRINVEDDQSPWYFVFLLNLLPVAALAGLMFIMMKRAPGAGGLTGNFSQSKAKLATDTGRVTFDDVAGVDEAKQDLAEVVDFLRHPERYTALGAEIPRGVLLAGPPGTGKTLMARAVAGEANVPFFSISGSDFVEMFVGVGASRVRQMFEKGRQSAPCIIFIDEIDAVGRQRGSGQGSNEEREQTLNQLLVEMDGFEENQGIILIAATNRVDILDKALTRPGRFDRHVEVPNPSLAGREAILKVHTRKKPLARDVDLQVIARGVPGFSGAELKGLANEAAIRSARRGGKVLTMDDFEGAKDKILMGAERRTLIMTDAEKKLTAYHEAGHAVVALSVPQADPVHKATILPRGRALGMVMQLPEGDRNSMTLTMLKSRLAITMAGRVAEEIIFGKHDVTTGAGGDIEMATKIARAMVRQWGLSEEIGMVDMTEDHASGAAVDAAVKKLIDESHAAARNILCGDMGALHRVAAGLLDHETLTGPQIQALKEGRALAVPESGQASALREAIQKAAEGAKRACAGCGVKKPGDACGPCSDPAPV